jgi:hypothetical protein
MAKLSESYFVGTFKGEFVKDFKKASTRQFRHRLAKVYGLDSFSKDVLVETKLTLLRSGGKCNEFIQNCLLEGLDPLSWILVEGGVKSI